MKRTQSTINSQKKSSHFQKKYERERSVAGDFRRVDLALLKESWGIYIPNRINEEELPNVYDQLDAA